MKTILVAIDAKYIQSNLAVRSISTYVKEHSGNDLEFAEFTINQPIRYILESLYSQKADNYMFSCYIWNIELIKATVTDLNKILPNSKIFFGGPEATYHAKALLDELPCLDGIVLGEGEETVLELLQCLEKSTPLSLCAGLALRNEFTPLRKPIPMDTIPFAYEDLGTLDGRIIYYESMRGCPFGCTYCLSSVEKGVHFRSLDLVYADIKRFFAAKIRQVKFVDRTFNCKKTHAMGIWQFIKDNDNGITNFHFELAGELIDDDMIELLKTFRSGLCQFEIGVQSTNDETLSEISRPWDFCALSEKVAALQENGNIHLHLDLIAGLPYENYSSFQNSFNDVYKLTPNQLQLGFLKVLGGSEIEEKSANYGLVYQSEAPYEVLGTNWITFDELTILHGIDDMVDHYYNSCRYSNTIDYMCTNEPFEFYKSLWEHFTISSKGKPVSKLGYYEILGSFRLSQGLPIDDTMQWLCKYDILLHEKIRRVPSWVNVDLQKDYRDYILDFYNNPDNLANYLPEYSEMEPKSVSKVAHIEIFPFNPTTFDKKHFAVLFNYEKRNILGHAASCIFEI